MALQSNHLWQGVIAEVDSGGATAGTDNGSKGPLNHPAAVVLDAGNAILVNNPSFSLHFQTQGQEPSSSSSMTSHMTLCGFAKAPRGRVGG